MAPGGSSMLVPLPEVYDQEEAQSSCGGSCFRGGILDVRIHDAQGIHNICIYDKQDVFAKFAFTHGKAEPFCTQVISKGGKNPVFNEFFQLPVTLPNSVLKCEMWMSSRAHNYLEDQLLGFVLVPLSTLVNKSQSDDDDDDDEVPDEYGLSSTELFHSPAGIVRLTLIFREGAIEAAHSQTNSPERSLPFGMIKKKKQHTFIKVFEDGCNTSSGSGSDHSPPCYDQNHQSEEFLDLQAASEDQQLVSSYLEMFSSNNRCSSSAGMITGPAFLFDGKSDLSGSDKFGDDGSSKQGNSSSSTSTSRDLIANSDDQSDSGSMKQLMNKSLGSLKQEELVMRNLSQESTVMQQQQQQQIVDMYMKSMQQFTEALAKMQLPLELDTINANKKSKSHQENEKNGGGKSHRVFYGSRAFF